MPYKDKKAQRHAQKLWARRHSEDQNLKRRGKKSNLRKFINSFKDVPCNDCGIKYPPCAMDFDHVRGNKKFNLSNAVKTMASTEEILEEIKKCDLVCANCHRWRTHKRKFL